jgi:glycosyltransferase involved in cell wall biosynthesis
VCWKSPYPTRGGLDLRVDGISRSLSSTFEVSIICMNASTRDTPDYISNIYVGPAVKTVENHEVIRWGRENPNDPFGVFVNLNQVEFIKDAVSNVDPDVVIISRLMTWRVFSQAFPKRKTPTLLDLDETSNRLKNSYEAASVLGPSVKVVGSFHARNIDYENQAISEADQIIVSSVLEEKDCATKLPSSKVSVIKNVVAKKTFIRTWGPERRRVIFPGNFDYAPNRVAFKFIINEIVPQLPEFKFVFAGSGLDVDRIKTPTNVEINAFPQDMNHEFERADFLVAPLIFGAGTRLKVLEAMNSETVVIATKFAVEGLEVEPNIHYQPAETAEEYIAALKNLGQDLVKCQFMARNARKLIENSYTPESIQGSLEDAIAIAKQ